jgi:hypothetical protein
MSMNMQNFALEQTTVELTLKNGDVRNYLLTAIPALPALQLKDELYKNDFVLDPTSIKRMVCGCAAFENKQITDKSFDILFARKSSHLQELVGEILKWNFEELFMEDDTEE